MSFIGAGFEVFDDMIIDSHVDVAGDFAADVIDFVGDPSFEDGVGLVAGYTNFGTNVAIDFTEDLVDMVEEEIDPTKPVQPTTTSSTQNGVTNIYNIYYGCPRPVGGVFENAFDNENEEEEITFEPNKPPPLDPVVVYPDSC